MPDAGYGRTVKMDVGAGGSKSQVGVRIEVQGGGDVGRMALGHGYQSWAPVGCLRTKWAAGLCLSRKALASGMLPDVCARQ